MISVSPLGAPTPIGSAYKRKGKPMEYAQGRVLFVDESQLAVIFARQGNRADGTPDDIDYYNHATGGWDNAYAKADHLRYLDRGSLASAHHDYTAQSFAAPMDVTDSPTAFARVYVVDSAGEIKSLVQQIASNHLHGLTRRWSSRP